MGSLWHDLVTNSGFFLGLLGTVLHFVAPRTKNTIDDKLDAVIQSKVNAKFAADTSP